MILLQRIILGQAGLPTRLRKLVHTVYVEDLHGTGTKEEYPRACQLTEEVIANVGRKLLNNPVALK